MGDPKSINTNKPENSCTFTLEAVPEKFALAQEKVRAFLEPFPCSAPAEKRPIGGLGIFLVQKYSDTLSYEYVGNENCLTIGKKLD